MKSLSFFLASILLINIAVADTKAPGPEKKPETPDKAQVDNATNSLQTAAGVLHGVNDIVSGMNRKGLKGFAQTITGTLNIAQLLDIGEANAMKAGAVAFSTEAGAMATSAVNSGFNFARGQVVNSKLQSALKAYAAAATQCAEQLSKSRNVCNESKNAKAIAVTQLVQSGTALIQQTSSASEVCSTTGDISKIAALGLSSVGLMCSQNFGLCKMRCEAEMKKALAVVKTISAELRVAMLEDAVSFAAISGSMKPMDDMAQGLHTKFTGAIASQETAMWMPMVMGCLGLAANVVHFASQVKDLMKSSAGADNCTRQLTAGGKGPSALTQQTTMAEMCAQPGTEQMQVCKCYKDQMSSGCPGHVASKVNTPTQSVTAATVRNQNGGVSQLAGFAAQKSAATNSGLSAAARAALGLGDQDKTADSTNSKDGQSDTSANTGGTGDEGGVGSGASAQLSGGGDSVEGSSKKKAAGSAWSFGNFSSMSGGVGSYFGGGAKGAKEDGQSGVTEEHLESAKRFIAAEQVRSQVSISSGKSILRVAALFWENNFMKNSTLKKMFSFGSGLVFFGALAAEPAVAYQQAYAAVGENEACKPSPNLGSDESGQPSFDYEYQACLNRNRQKDQLRANISRGLSDANAVADGPPKAPTNNCNQTGQDFSTCQHSYNQAYSDYQRQMMAYNSAKNAQASAAMQAQTEQQRQLAQLQNTSATGSMAELQSKNTFGKTLYAGAAAVLAYKGAEKIFKAQITAAKPGGYVKAIPLFAAGAAFMLMSKKSNRQSGQHGVAAYESCMAFNKLSSEQKDCAGLNNPVTINTNTLDTMYTNDGQCKPGAPKFCVSVAPTSGGKGVTKMPSSCSQGGKTVSCLGLGMGVTKLNPDGTVSVQTPQGEKVYSEKDFADVKSMQAAGLPADVAKQLYDDLYGADSAFQKAEKDTKDALAGLGGKGLNSLSGSYGSMSEGGSLGSAEKSGLGTTRTFSEELPSALEDARRPTSEGLSRDFNGDLIGASGDDIFTMMNRRYKLKNEQESFITP
jgi:hypothetical protein